MQIDRQIQTTEELRAHIVHKLSVFDVPTKTVDNLTLQMSFLLAHHPIDSNSPLFDFETKATESARSIGVGKAEFVVAALKQPSLFCQSPETLNRNVEESARAMGVGKAQFLAAALKHSQLFCQSPETLNRNVEESVRLMGVGKAQFVAAALKQPQLFYQSPETLNRNVEESALSMGVGKAEFVAAALKNPQLFYQSPETLNSNVEESARSMGVGKAQFVAAALKQPQLFYQSPKTIVRHARLAADLYRAGHVVLPPVYGQPSGKGDTTPLLKWLCESSPSVLCLADGNFALRSELASLRGTSAKGNILAMPRHRAEREVAERLGYNNLGQPLKQGDYDPSQAYENPKTPAERHGRLCHLIETGLIKGIKLEPAGVQPITAPIDEIASSPNRTRLAQPDL